MVNLISTLFGFQRIHNLGHYLGDHLFHQRVTSSTLQFVVEKVRGKLQSWEAKKLSLVGHVTLTQSALLSIPSYFMQSMMIPRKIWDEIECLGSPERQKKMSLVGWDSIFQPRACGGLGLTKLRD
ncbi:Retrovirus-related Pol polyprotein LINE-1 [Gossypium australe]|uniref:Retrovirus-related Pol polyprotein LINE-1 n=1 Tax=Gossypium australe TaxID=47621 RepID=A0A5B6VZQ0_9ROSI|nr:Retrovirus-related Pol polyprotein LINE-1 [Gossypium australe]